MAFAPGRYCLATCYCRLCDHWQPYELTDQERRRLLAYLKAPPAYRSGTSKQAPSYRRDPLGKR
jgi:hypothetical protein